jgi:hypothetical protein
VVGGCAATVVFDLIILLEDGIYCGFDLVGSDRWVGSYTVTLFDYSSGGASVISVSSFCCLSCIYYYSVCCKLFTSVCSYIIVATSLEWFAVYGGSSILSKQLALYLALSILLFCAYRISRRSTGVGVAVAVIVSVFVLSSPRSLRILDMSG